MYRTEWEANCAASQFCRNQAARRSRQAGNLRGFAVAATVAAFAAIALVVAASRLAQVLL
jgi:hypothetical protein